MSNSITAFFMKGWVHSLSPDEMKNACNEVGEIVKQHPDVKYIFWDGDLLKHDSYTVVIEHLMKSYSNLVFVAFKKCKSMHKLKADFKDEDYGVPCSGYDMKQEHHNIDEFDLSQLQGLPMVVIGVPKAQIKNWTDLAYIGYRTAKEKFGVEHGAVITIGEGKVVKDEIHELKKQSETYPHMTFTRLPVTRSYKNREGKIVVEKSPIDE